MLTSCCSLYQVFLLPVVGAVLFNCSRPPPLQHLVAQLDLQRVGMEFSFTVGDGRYYGGVFNAPLETGRNYYVVLRAVRRWKTVSWSSPALISCNGSVLNGFNRSLSLSRPLQESQSSCILWAKVLGKKSLGCQIVALISMN